MFPRRLLPFAGALALATLSSIHHAHATTAILPNGAALPLDQRVAVAVSPSRTTIWTNLRLDTAAGPVGLLIPVPPGAALDHTSDAWLEALDDATAPRVFPPNGAAHVCPGITPDPMTPLFHTTTYPMPMSSLEPVEYKILADVPAVLAWATTHGFSVSAATSTALGKMSGMRFFVERFDPIKAPFFTSTLRVVLPSSTPVLPLALTQAGSTDLRITTWFIGAGRAALTGSSPVGLPMNALQWLAASSASNYAEMRDATLVAAGPAAIITEAASHDALVKNVSIASGKGSIPGVVTGYFERAEQYFDSAGDTTLCILSAGVALDSTIDVATACPSANLGIVDGTPTCVEAPNGSEVDPATLRCGGRTDDLAIALSDLQPSSTWLTRMTMVVPKQSSGQTWPITFATVAPQVDPSEIAASISFTGCTSTGSSSSSTSGFPGSSSSSGNPSTTSSGGGGNRPTTYDLDDDSDMDCGCGGPAPVIIDDTSYGGYGGYGGAGGGGGAGGDAYYYDDSTSDDCDGSTESTDPAYDESSTSDDCDGSTESTDPAYDESSTSDDCDGSTTDGTDSSSDSDSSDEGIDCSGDTEGGGGSTDSTDTGDSSDSSATSAWSDSRDSSACAVARHPRAKPHKRGPKASVLTLGLLAILAPLRRLSRPRRTKRDPQDKLASPRVR